MSSMKTEAFNILFSIKININSRFHFKHDNTKELLISTVKED